MRRGVTRRLIGDPLAEIAGHPHTRNQIAVGADRADDPRFGLAALCGVAAQRLLRDAALACDLKASGEHRLRVLDHAVHQLVAGVHPELAANLLDDSRRLPAVVGVGMGADHQPDFLQAQAAHRQRPLEVGHRVRLVHPGVEQDEAMAGLHSPGVAVGHTRPGQRQAQPVDAGKHTLATSQLLPTRHISHAAQTRLTHLQAAYWRRRRWLSRRSASEASYARSKRRPQTGCSRSSEPRANASRAIATAEVGRAHAISQAIGARDLDARRRAVGRRRAHDNVRGQMSTSLAPAGRPCVSSAKLLDATPDLDFQVALDDHARTERCAVQYRMKAVRSPDPATLGGSGSPPARPLR